MSNLLTTDCDKRTTTTIPPTTTTTTHTFTSAPPRIKEVVASQTAKSTCQRRSTSTFMSAWQVTSKLDSALPDPFGGLDGQGSVPFPPAGQGEGDRGEGIGGGGDDVDGGDGRQGENAESQIATSSFLKSDSYDLTGMPTRSQMTTKQFISAALDITSVPNPTSSIDSAIDASDSRRAQPQLSENNPLSFPTSLTVSDKKTAVCGDEGHDESIEGRNRSNDYDSNGTAAASRHYYDYEEDAHFNDDDNENQDDGDNKTTSSEPSIEEIDILKERRNMFRRRRSTDSMPTLSSFSCGDANSFAEDSDIERGNGNEDDDDDDDYNDENHDEVGSLSESMNLSSQRMEILVIRDLPTSSSTTPTVASTTLSASSLHLSSSSFHRLVVVVGDDSIASNSNSNRNRDDSFVLVSDDGRGGGSRNDENDNNELRPTLRRDESSGSKRQEERWDSSHHSRDFTPSYHRPRR